MENPPPRGMSKSRLYPIVGALLAQGAPLGLVALRALSSGRASVQSVGADLAADSLTYIYLTVSTTLVFVLLGVLLGKNADTLEESSLTDQLTRLPNRRYFEARVTAELERAKRDGSPLCLLLVDVDHLKEINDDAGHRGGDVALRTVADAISASRRASDVVARWGGDEFTLLAPGIDAEGGLVIAERIRDALRRVPPGHRGTAPTVSVGVADVGHAENRTLEGLCAAADTALYEAKGAGRNRARAYLA